MYGVLKAVFVVIVLLTISARIFHESQQRLFYDSIAEQQRERQERLFRRCPICYAAFVGNLTDVNRLIDSGANPNAVVNHGETVLHFAARRGPAEIVKVLLSAGANSNAATDDGLTALHEAAERGNAEIAKVLLSAGANPKAENNLGWTALDLAKETGRSEIVRILRAAGARE